MPRVKRSVQKRKRRKNIIKQAKGYKWRRKATFKEAKQAVMKALSYAYRDRKAKKRIFRRDWQAQINKAVRQYGLSYSKFMNLLKKSKIELNRKILAQLSKEHPEIFKEIVEKAKKA
ncbi:MAG: 50S ribosomal protein L20 [bacterium]